MSIDIRKRFIVILTLIVLALIAVTVGLFERRNWEQSTPSQ